MTSELFDVAILGAGPIGLELALRVRTAGWTAVVLETGKVAANVHSWGHVRMFTPFSMNSSKLGRQRLSESGHSLPASDTILTGGEFRTQYLQPLSELPELAESFRWGRTCQSIGRTRYAKSDLIGQTARLADPFRIRSTSRNGEETWRARTVVDCSGTFGRHRCAGAGGMPAEGELEVLTPEDYHIPDVRLLASETHSWREVLVIGDGFSAATTVVELTNAQPANADLRIYWRTRREAQEPICPIDDDVLEQRQSLTQAANQLARESGQNVDWQPGWVLERLRRLSSGRIQVELRSVAEESDVESLVVDHVFANVGYRPDRSLYEELQVHECYASQGPMGLAAHLLGQAGGDCMSTSGGDASVLRNPEPGFLILGSKSYGRDARFLLRTGLQQIEDAMPLLAEWRASSQTGKGGSS